jgi:hypothetical protein
MFHVKHLIDFFVGEGFTDGRMESVCYGMKIVMGMFVSEIK